MSRGVRLSTSALANSPFPGTASSTNLPLWLSFQYAHDPGNASLFNHASMAVNNHFFFKSLSPKKTEPTTPFLRDIEDSFSSYDTLRTEMIETADAMFGPGFVWIVKDNEQGRMKILCTYLAGSPYPQAHPRVQKVDMATSRPSARPRYENQQPSNGVGSFGNYTYQGMVSSKRAQNGFIAFPILCVNTWEHMYLRDHGIHGKRAYLEAWWERIDWAVVESEAKQIKESSSGFDNVLRSQNFSAPGYRSRIR